MAAETSVKPVATNGFDDDDDDDGKPLVFRRNGSAGSISSLKQSTTDQKTKMVTSTNSPKKPPLANPRPPASQDDQSRQSSLPVVTNGFDDDDDEDQPIVFRRNGSAGSTSSLKGSATGQKTKVVTSTNLPKKSPLANPRPSASPDDQSRESSLPVVKKENQTPKMVSQPKIEDEDSDDEKPLSFRFKVNKDPGSVGPGVSPPMRSSKPTSENPNKSIKTEDSDDETPISSRLQLKTKVGTPVGKPEETGDKKPLASKAHQNGIVKNEMRSSQLSGKRPVDRPNLVSSSKRPLEKGNSSEQSAGKKPKLLGTCTTVKAAKSNKTEASDDDDENLTIANRRKTPASKAKSPSTKRKTATAVSKSSKKIIKKSQKATKNAKYSKSSATLPSGDGQKKWTTLVHNGVIFPPPYKPHGIKILYKGKQVDLTPEQEEVATMFAVMKETDYYNKPTFRENFWNDWRQLLGKKHLIQDLENCNFDPIYEWHLQEKEKKKQMSTDEKKALKEEKLKQEEKYMWAVVDGVKEKVGNFRVEPPGLFRGRGEHPKMGKLKKRIHPSDITINIGKGVPIPECPIPGESWKEVRHDNTVTWLAYWYDPINTKEFKYVFLAASSALKGQSDKEKYEKARKLKDYIKNIRAAYTKNFTSKDIMKQQIAVATYLIDKLALRAGNEKDDDEAETVGCCTLKVGNVECIPPNKLKFDFLGKDSIQYVNTVEVEPPVYKAIGQFQSKKAKSDDLFDQLDTSKLNTHLKELMPGLTAKVFRTYNASITLDEMLSAETKDGDVTQKVVVYQHANKEVAIICNHQRTVSKTHGAQIERLTLKMDELKGVIKELKTDLDRAKKGKPPLKDSDGKQKRNLAPEALEKKIAQTNAKIEKIERDIDSKEDLKTVALGTSKINYMDPRISVAWCKRHEVPIEKIFNKSLLAKFAWAMDVDPEFRF